jgi:Zn-finger nucleic acid-binding protein
MEAGIMRCPSCGAVASSDATACSYCSAKLMTQACPKCFGMYFAGIRYCPHCGVDVVMESATAPAAGPCPECHVPMEATSIGHEHLCRCANCQGIWLGPKELELICSREEIQATMLDQLPPVGPPPKFSMAIKYRKCPTCSQLMSRKNFANRSGVVVDICKAHGVWLDKDELRRIIEFVRAGGLIKARADQIANLNHLAESQANDRLYTSDGHLGFGESSRYYGQTAFDNGTRGINVALDIASLVIDLFK